MSKNMVCKGCVLQDITGNGHVKIESEASTEVALTEQGFYFGTIFVSVQGSNGGGQINNLDGNGVGTLTGTGTSITLHGQPAILDGDTGIVYVSGTRTDPSPSGPVTTSVRNVPVTVKIINAGQTQAIAL